MPKERPILFSGPMVRAIMEGRKTMTRRVVTEKIALEWLAPPSFTLEFIAHPENHLCRYGNTGDHLWVRETFCPCMCNTRCLEHIAYRATDMLPPISCWKPSIHMPRWASRLTLEIVSVRVERVQDISEEDAKAEGVEWTLERERLFPGLTGRNLFFDLWDRINAKRGFPWMSNPWVWVIEFKKV